MNVAVAAARIAGACACPVSASSPLGTSSASIGAPLALAQSTSDAYGPPAGRARPMPNSPSTTSAGESRAAPSRSSRRRAMNARYARRRRAAGVADRREKRRRRRGTQQRSKRASDERVAAVVAGSREHDDGSAAVAAHAQRDLRRRRARALHQRLAGDAGPRGAQLGEIENRRELRSCADRHYRERTRGHGRVMRIGTEASPR